MTSEIEKMFMDRQHYEKDGHIYCRVCNEQVDGKTFEIFGETFCTRKRCRCDIDRAEKEEALEREQEVRRLKRECFPAPVYATYTFDRYEGSDRKELTIAKNYADNFKKMEDLNVGLLLYGNVGSGKTFLSCCIANELMEKQLMRVKMSNFSQIINDLQKGGYEMDRNAYVRNLTSPRLLILDDLGIERDTAYAKEQVYNIINERYIQKKATIFTTNLTLKEITEGSDVEYQRIYSRITELCLPVLVSGDDRRKKIQDEKRRMVESILLGGGDK